MASEQDIIHRLQQLETQEERASDLVNKLERAVDRLSIHINQFKEEDILDRIRHLEIEMSNQKMIGQAIKWLGVSIGGTAVLLSISYMFGLKGIVQ